MSEMDDNAAWMEPQEQRAKDEMDALARGKDGIATFDDLRAEAKACHAESEMFDRMMLCVQHRAEGERVSEMDALERVKDGITCSYDAAFLYYIDNEPSDITTGDLRALIRECEAARALFATLQGGPAQIVYAPLERVKAELAAYYAARKGSE